MVDEFSREITWGKPRTRGRWQCVRCNRIPTLSGSNIRLSYKKLGSFSRDMVAVSQNALHDDSGSALTCVVWVGGSALNCAKKRNWLGHLSPSISPGLVGIHSHRKFAPGT